MSLSDIVMSRLAPENRKFAEKAIDIILFFTFASLLFSYVQGNWEYITKTLDIIDYGIILACVSAGAFLILVLQSLLPTAEKFYVSQREVSIRRAFFWIWMVVFFFLIVFVAGPDSALHHTAQLYLQDTVCFPRNMTITAYSQNPYDSGAYGHHLLYTNNTIKIIPNNESISDINLTWLYDMGATKINDTTIDYTPKLPYQKRTIATGFR